MVVESEVAACECDVVLSDGGTVHVRPITPDDGPRLLAFHSRLSRETIYLRFFGSHLQLTPDEVKRFTHVDGCDRMALVATLGDEIVAVGRYDRSPAKPNEAEVAFVVEDSHQGRGIGTLLLEHLAIHALSQGVTVFEAQTLPVNHPMQEVFKNAGFAGRSRFDHGIVDVRMDLACDQRFQDAVDERSRLATVRSIERLLRPRSVAVIGAGPQSGTIGHEVFRNLFKGGFTGPVYPVHPSAASVEGIKAYSSVEAVPGEVDLAVLAVPQAAVAEVIEACGDKGVRSVVVISAGFAEVGEDGRSAQDRIVNRARGAGMRLVGPNCFGIINTADDVSLNATFAPVAPEPGRVAFASQSGGLGIAVIEEARRHGIGLSSFVSVGNKADVSGNDLIRYWEQDACTDVIMLYLESFGNPGRFAQIARQVSHTKPILALKAGRTDSGRRAASSHTAALASPDVAVDALFAQTGVIRANTLEELFDTAELFSSQPFPAGRRVAIVSNAGGPGILAADACESAGLRVAELSEQAQDSLRAFLPAAASVANPVDMIASATAEDYQRVVSQLLQDTAVDAVVAIFVPPLVTEPDAVALAIATASRGAGKPVVANFLGVAPPPAGLRAFERPVPNFAFPEAAVRALARASEYGEWLCRPSGRAVSFADLDIDRGRAVVQSELNCPRHGGWLEPGRSIELLGAYGIRVADSTVVQDVTQAVEAAERIRYPVVLKAANPELVHKTKAGAVHLGLSSEPELRSAFAAMEKSLGDKMAGAVVQAMVDEGVETIVGLVNDPSFGPLVMFGTGGTAVELFADRAVRTLPMTDTDAADLVRSVRGSPLLFGFRGSPPANVTALEGLLLRVARLAEDNPEIAEMDLNPVIVGPQQVQAIDVKIRVSASPSQPDPNLRRLR
jgi:acetyl coenzyme A synthetase (ADP forming)-like protein